MRQSYTVVVERNTLFSRAFRTEPYECGWAKEVIVFVRTLKGDPSGINGSVDFSPDGINWCPSGLQLALPVQGAMSFVQVKHFGNWLSISGDLGEKTGQLIVTFHLKE